MLDEARDVTAMVPTPTFRPLSGLSIEELVSEFGTLFGFSAVLIARAAAVYGELTRRGVTITIPGMLFKEWVPKVSAGLVAAEAVASFADAPALMQIVAKMAPAEQRAMASGQRLQVVPAVGVPPVEMTLREAYDQGLKSVVVHGRILSPELQERQLTAQQMRATAPKVRAKAAIPAAVARGPATETEIDQLTQRLEREVQARGNQRLTARQCAELCAMFQWVPISREG